MGPRQAGPGLSLAVLAQRCGAQLVGDGNIVIADGTVISGATGVFGNIREPGIYTSVFPALPHRVWKHVASLVRRLRSLAERVLALERCTKHKGS